VTLFAQIRTTLIVLLLCGVSIERAAKVTKAQEAKGQVNLLLQAAYASVPPLEESDFERKRPPKPGDWLASFPESGQSLESYQQRDARVLVTQRRKVIVLQPLGSFSPAHSKVLIAMKEYSEAFFQIPTRISNELSLPDPKKKDLGRLVARADGSSDTMPQYDAMKLIDTILLKRVPEDAAIYIGVTMHDLFAKDMNFVFGLGSFDKRCGVYSLARYFPEFWGEQATEQTGLDALRRSFKVLNHEASHVLGLRHCIFYECTMNGSNSLPETDRAPIHECPICHRKLQWNLRFDPTKRFEDLRTCYKKFGLDAESSWTHTRLEHWEASRPR
jgi:archaemetzincin